eukprot:1161562-Pelagomonas_calceolata.AAC.4
MVAGQGAGGQIQAQLALIFKMAYGTWHMCTRPLLSLSPGIQPPQHAHLSHGTNCRGVPQPGTLNNNWNTYKKLESLAVPDWGAPAKLASMEPCLSPPNHHHSRPLTAPNRMN